MSLDDNKVNINLDKFELFDESYKSKITFLAKITQIAKLKEDNFMEAYLFTSHGENYILKKEMEKPLEYLSPRTININIEKVNDFFDDFINKLNKDNLFFAIPKEKNLYTIKSEPGKYKTNILTIDINDRPIIKSNTDYENTSYIDFMSYLGRKTNENIDVDYVNLFLNGTRPGVDGGIRPAFIFGDGTRLSIQAGIYHHCIPKTNDTDHYECVECGFPSNPIPQLEEYKEIPGDPQEVSVFPYVPVGVLNNIIKERGIDQNFLDEVLSINIEK